MTIYQMGRYVAADEWRLQWRGIGNWLGRLLLLVVILSLHPLWEVGANGFTALEAAAIWSDRAVIVGAMYVLFVAPFVLDRIRRTQIEAVEMSKPFWKRPYLLGKFIGALLPTVLLLLPLSGLLNFIVTLFTASDVDFLPLLLAHGRGYLLIVLPPILFLSALGYFLSLRLRPIVIVPLMLLYLERTTVSQQAANAQFSWLSSIVRPEYFPSWIIPNELGPMVLLHQFLYLAAAAILVLLTVGAFRRQRAVGVGSSSSRFNWRQRWQNLPVMPGSVGLRRFWGVPVVAALVMAVLSPAIALDVYSDFAWVRLSSAVFVLEFYFPLAGLLLIAGVVARDNGVHTLDLVLTKPINRWKLLVQRLLPAVATYLVVAIVLILAIHLTFMPLPLGKVFLVAMATGLYLGMVGMTAANVTRSALAGYGVGLVYWLLEAGFQGRFTAPFFLLMASHQPDVADFWRNTESLWLPNKIGLLLLAGWLFILNGWLLDQGASRRRALAILGVTIPLIFALGWWMIPLLWR